MMTSHIPRPVRPGQPCQCSFLSGGQSGQPSACVMSAAPAHQVAVGVMEQGVRETETSNGAGRQ